MKAIICLLFAMLLGVICAEYAKKSLQMAAVEAARWALIFLIAAIFFW